MFRKTCLIAFIVLTAFLQISAQSRTSSFKVIPLGVKGGIEEDNLSAYLLAPEGSDGYICLDAGTLNTGIRKAIETGVLKGKPDEVLRKQIKGYLISHGHLDHVSGLIINSPEDSVKKIYGMPKVLGVLRDKYFTWDAWANFGNEGEKPMLKKYSYTALEEKVERPLDGTEMIVKAFTLSHGNPYQSTAFLVGHQNSYALYLGDTGADEIEKSDKMRLLWEQVAPLINKNELKGVFLEVSFPNEQPENLLFGHLTPKLFFKELGQLKNLCKAGTFEKVNFIITHIKPPLQAEELIRKELKEANTENFKLIFPKQGELLLLN
ncbi:3',5'-cyclic-nucleotide phosphodiesterase [Pedobacter sp.]|jgi:cAMP phosphodiesterase|uniref:3',5'-cyclic-nucleotide phosphodiesterase n=1 Tax=Pedobacter sp. TaxID=1411316 RepID=UPI002BF6711F|nr:3',5'-cyclic-nucleotide phosphodiesterase [Pedobacter sp.]HWW42396.1 3',5'-cyclic-nucleotide phosphodiesterase [Pedobacter sp.]